MLLPSSYPWHRSAGNKLLRVWLCLALMLSLTTFTVAAPEPSYAAPSLSVSTSVSDPLLGGTATVSITVTNNGDVKGYNLSVDALLASNLPNPAGRVTIGSSSVPPTTVRLNPGTGDTDLEFFDMVDLAPTESFTLTFEVDISGDPGWEVGDLLTLAVDARVNDIPDNSGTWYAGADSAQGTVTPILLVVKDANQSTGVQQATGTEGRAYTYTLDVQNNYTNPTASVVLTDTIPDGVEFLGVASGPALDPGYPVRDPATGITQLKWTLGTMAPGQNTTIVYDAGIRYDYYGTANGGTNRLTTDFVSTPATAAIIPHKTSFLNTAGLQSAYRGSLPATITPYDTDSASVEGTYMTIDKGGSPSSGGYGTIIDYTLTYVTSQYFTADTLTVTDTLPDGLTYAGVTGGTPAPASVTPNPDGTTVIIWGPTELAALGTTDGAVLTFQASMDTTWERAPYAGQPIRAGDSMTNTAKLAGTWYDQVKPPRTDSDVLVATVNAALSTGLPGIEKAVWDPDLSMWTDTIDAQVGDDILYRLRFNTNDGATPLRDDISMGYMTVTDWLPPGVLYNGDAVPTYDATFTVPTTGTPPAVNPDTPANVSIGSLSGLEWFLGDVSADGWWETTFTVTVQNVPVVAEGLKTGNHWKMTGINTFGQEYSDRDIATLEYVEPRLSLDKNTISVPSPLVAGSTVGYRVTIGNSGLGSAEDVLVTDTLPVGMRGTPPAITAITLNGSPLIAGVDYTTSYAAGTGVWLIDLHDGAIDTPIPAAGQLVIEYDSVVDTGIGAGRTLTDLATVSYDTQPDGTGRTVPGTSSVSDPNTDDASVTLSPLRIRKNWPGGPYTVGDTFVASIDVTVPVGATAYIPRIVDTMNRDGVYYVPGSASISTLAGTPPGPASFASTSTPTRGGTGSNNLTTLTWNFANPIDNSGQSTEYAFRLTFSLQYTGVRDNGTQEFWQPTANDRVTNQSAVVSWATTNVGTRDASATYNPASVWTNIDQPRLTLAKTVTTPGPYAGNSTVGYRVVLANNGWSPAYDLDWADTLPTYIDTPVLTGVTHSALGNILGSITPDFTSPPALSIDFDAVSLAPGQTITITYTAVVDPDVPASVNLANLSDIDWSSLPGTPAGSRRYDDNPAWESGYLADTDFTSISIASPTIVKTIVGPNPARIGDDVTYRLRVTVPAETVLPDSYLSDTIATDGLTYNAGSAAFALVSGSPQIAAALSGVVFDDSPNPGSTVRFDLVAPIDNSSAAPTTGDTPYVFDLTYTMRVDAITDAAGWRFFPPTAADTIADTGRIHWTVGGSPTSASSAATLDVDQPRLTLNKTEQSTGPYAGGDTVNYRVVIDNTAGFARAYDLSWEDILAPNMSDPTLVSVTHSALGDIIADVTPDFSDGDMVTVDFDNVSLGTTETITIDYSASIDPGAGAGSSQTNTADVDWTSHPASPDKRVYNDSPAEAAWTADTDQATVSVADALIVKTIESGITTRTIGQEYEYFVSFSIPASTTAYNMVISDLVPDGLTVLYATPSDAIGSVSVGAEVAGETPVSWDLGDVTNPPYGTLVLTIGVRVDNAFNGGAPLDGLPPGVDGDVQSSILNRARIDWDTADVAGTPMSSTSDVTITAVEPHLTIDKSASRASLGAAEEVTFTVTVTNDGSSTAHEMRWLDHIPASLFSAGASPSLVTVTLDGSPLTGGVDFTADFATDQTATVDFAVPLAPGSSAVIVYTARLNGGIPNGTPVTNDARVTEYRSLPSAATGERVSGPVSDSVTLTALAPSVLLDKSVVGDAQLQAGQEATFRLDITNTGTAPAFSVLLTDTLPPGVTYVPGSTTGILPGIGAFSDDPAAVGPSLVWDFGGALDLAVGQTATYTFRASIESTASLGTATNATVASAEDGAGFPVTPSSDTQDILITRPDISLLKLLAPAQDPFVQFGQQVTFDLIVTNSGSTILDIVPLSDTFEAAYLSFAGASVAPDGSSAGLRTWSDLTGAGSLAVGASTTVTVTFDVIGHPPASSTVNTASVSPATDQYGDPTPTATSAATIGITAPSVAVDKRLAASQNATVSAGDTVDYEIELSNSGDTTITALALSDIFDSSVFELVSATPAEDSSGPAGTLTWTDITTSLGDIAPGDSVVVDVTLRGRNAAVSSVNTATITSATDINGDTPAPDSDTASATVVEPLLTLTKSADRVLMGPGETAVYTLTLTNIGTGPAFDVVLGDAVPSELWSPYGISATLDSVPLAAGVDYVTNLSAPTMMAVTLASPLQVGETFELQYSVDLAGGTAGGTVLTNTAGAVASSLPGADPEENVYGPITDSWTITSQAPVISLDKTVIGDTELQHGQDGTFQLRVTNVGDATAYSVVLTDTLPAGLTYVPGSSMATWSGAGSSSADPAVNGSTLVWSFPPSTILPGETLTLTFDANVDPAAAVGIKPNTGVAGASDGGGVDIAPSADLATILVTVPGASVSKQLAVGQDPFIQVGEQVTFDVVVSNSGDTTIAVLPLTDTFDPAYLEFIVATPSADTTAVGSASWTDLTTLSGDLAPGEQTTVTVTFAAIAHPPTSASTNTAAVAGATDAYGDPIPVVGDSEDIGITAPAVAITKSVSAGEPSTVRLGETTTFDLAVTNTGDTVLDVIPLTDVYDPATVSFVSANPGPDTAVAGTLTWDDITASLGNLSPGQTTTVTVTVRAEAETVSSPDTATVSGVVDINGDAAADDSDTETVTIVQPVLTIDKTVGSATLDPGQVTTYTVDITNTGTGAAYDVAWADTIPAELTFGSSPLLLGVTLDGSPLTDGVDYIADFSVSTAPTIDLLAPIGSGQVVRITYTASLIGGLASGLTFDNLAEVTEYSSLPGTDINEWTWGSISDTETITTRAPWLGITKLATGDLELQAGQNAHFTVVLSNTGDASAFDPAITDALPTGLSYVAGSAVIVDSSAGTTTTTDPTIIGSAATWSLGGTEVLPGETVVITFEAHVELSAPTGVATNGISAVADDGAGEERGPVTDSDDVLVTRPEVAIDKHLAPGQDAHIQVGEQVSFEIVLTNTGTTAIDVLPLTDLFDPAYLDLVSAAPSSDSTSVGTVDWIDLTGAGSLAIGDATTVTVTFSAIGHPAVSSTTDTATVSGAIDEYSDPAPDVTDSAAIGITAPSVSIAKTLAAGQDPVFALGEPVVYDVAVTNTGDTTLAVVPVVDTFDSSALAFTDAMPAPGSVSTETLNWNDITVHFGDMAPGSTATMTVAFEAIAPSASAVNTASVPAGAAVDEFGDFPAGVDATIAVGTYDIDDVTLIKDADPAPGTIVLPGDVLTYTLTFTNGTPVVLPSVEFLDELPDSVTYVAGSILLESGAASFPLTDDIDGDEAAFEGGLGPQGAIYASFGDVSPDATVSISFQVKIRAEEFSRRGVRNYATATSAGEPIAGAGPVDHPVDPIEIIKTGRDINGGRLMAGDQIEWTITITNTGLTPTTRVRVDDTVPSETVYVSGSITGRGGDDSNAPDLAWDVGTLRIDESVVLTFRSSVKAGLPKGTVIRNQATVRSDQSAPKRSDSPETPEIGDATLLQTGSDDRLWIGGVLAGLIAAAWLMLQGRRRLRSA